jgi:hypothetical protein
MFVIMRRREVLFQLLLRQTGGFQKLRLLCSSDSRGFGVSSRGERERERERERE